jgi:hypothetical protein
MSSFTRFSNWLAASTVASSCQSVLSTEAMLSVLLGTEAQTWNYVGRDVLGQLGGLLVLSGLTKQSDKHPTPFLWFSHAFQQASMGLLMYTPSLAPGWFLPVAAVANLCANVSFVGYGSINAKCIQKLSAEKNNVGELYSKLTIHQTLGSTAGLSLGMLLNEHWPWDSGMLFLGLGIVRVYCCNRAVRNVL